MYQVLYADSVDDNREIHAVSGIQAIRQPRGHTLTVLIRYDIQNLDDHIKETQTAICVGNDQEYIKEKLHQALGEVDLGKIRADEDDPESIKFYLSTYDRNSQGFVERCRRQIHVDYVYYQDRCYIFANLEETSTMPYETEDEYEQRHKFFRMLCKYRRQWDIIRHLSDNMVHRLGDALPTRILERIEQDNDTSEISVQKAMLDCLEILFENIPSYKLSDSLITLRTSIDELQKELSFSEWNRRYII